MFESLCDSYGEGPEDAADYTIRSPYPTVHLLRECDLLEAVEGYPNADRIPDVNKRRLRNLGIPACEASLAECFHPASS